MTADSHSYDRKKKLWHSDAKLNHFKDTQNCLRCRPDVWKFLRVCPYMFVHVCYLMCSCIICEY